MKKSALHILLLVAILISAVSVSVAQEKYVPNQLLVLTNGTESESRLQEMNTSCGTRIEQSLVMMTSRKIYLLQITDGRSVEDAIHCWRQFSEVESAEPNYIMKPMK